jgi:hypothetical protein
MGVGASVGVLRQVCRLNILPPRVPGERCVSQIEDEQNKVIGEEPAACQDPQKYHQREKYLAFAHILRHLPFNKEMLIQGGAASAGCAIGRRT